MHTIVLNEIYIYPVKSLAGIKIEQWPVSGKGFLYDRKWMLIDQDNRFLSQRQAPRMALIRTAVEDDQLILKAAGQKNLSIPLNPESGDRIETRIWQDTCVAHSVSDIADQWFSNFLNLKCRLVYQPDSTLRQVDPQYGETHDKINFSDGFPFLLVSENSLAALNQAMNLSYSMTRFRPNLVISGCPEYAEDTWREITIGEINFRLPKPCSRCIITTIDPDTGEFCKEPLTTLNRTRKWNNNVYFGQNALHDNIGILRTGDRVTIVETGDLQPPLSPV